MFLGISSDFSALPLDSSRNEGVIPLLAITLVVRCMRKAVVLFHLSWIRYPLRAEGTAARRLKCLLNEESSPSMASCP